MLAVSVLAEGGNTIQKRAAPEYAYRPRSQYSQNPSVSTPFKSLEAVLAKSGPSFQQDYLSAQPAAPGLSQAQQYYQEQAETPAAAYAQPSATKYVSIGAGSGSASPAEAQKVRAIFSYVIINKFSKQLMKLIS